MDNNSKREPAPSILTTTVGSYPYPAWLAAMPTEQSILDATRVVVDIQRQAGIDLPTDGELYRFDVNHPETNGMIEYFITPLAGVRKAIGRSDSLKFQRKQGMGFRRKPAGVVEGSIREGALNLPADCERSVSVAGGNLKFTVTSPYMLARTLLDKHYGNFEARLLDLAGVLAAQVADLECACVQVDEANLPGDPEEGPLAARAINLLLDAVARRIEKAEKALGEDRIGWVHPDCGFWMLHRSVAERKITALVQGRDLYLGR